MEHLLKAAEEGASEEVTLESVMAYATSLDEHDTELKRLEKLVKAEKKIVNKLKQELLPNALNEIGLHSLELKSGASVATKEDVNCKVVDYDKLYSFLEERGDDSLMKTTIETGKLPKSILAAVIKLLNDTFELDATGGMSIHTQTLNSYFRNLCGFGAGDAEMSINDVDEDMVKIFTYYKTTIKR